MHYAYGDSSASPFTANFLELLRDSIDFAVYVLHADRRIRETQTRAGTQQRMAEVELAEIDALEHAVTTTIESASARTTDAVVAECAAKMTLVCEQTVRASAAGVKQRLAENLARAEAEEKAERNGCVKALLGLLSSQPAPGSSHILRLTLPENEGYRAALEGQWPGIGLSWKCKLAVPAGHPFMDVLRVQDLKQHLAIHAPEYTGWIKKEVKVKPQHLERLVIHEVEAAGPKVVLRLRTEAGEKVGFDFELDSETNGVAAFRIAGDEEQLVAGPFPVHEEDQPKLVELCQTVHASLLELRTARLIEAKLGDRDFERLPHFHEIAERLIGFLAPFANEIAAHSLEPDELVLRRQLANNRREEIFVSKTTLRQKYESLTADLRRLFEPLGLHAPLSRSLPPAAHVEQPALRSELLPSDPPPPPAKPSVPPVASEPPPPSLNAASSVPPDEPKATSEELDTPNEPSQRSAFERIVELANEGHQDAAFRECASLLEGFAFRNYSPEDQRRALRLLLGLGSPARPSYGIRRAHRAGRDRAKALIERFGEPEDYELLGLCLLALNETTEARKTFGAGLDLERHRRPESELCERLRSHVA